MYTLIHTHTHTCTVSHELRTPLNGIIGLSESLLEDEECPPSITQTLEIILSSGHRLNSLVNDILDAASFKQGVLQVKHQSVHVAEVADQVQYVIMTLCVYVFMLGATYSASDTMYA
jgi:signal transduction histidine kinase